MDQSGGLYAKLEERILARDQIGASAVYYDLVRAERPRAEIVGETVRIHAPYTHVPYHQRIDDGFVRFVNNDHCLLSARTSLRLPKLLSPALEYLPLAQTIWYVPTGLDPWNQLLGKMPGHYGGRGQKAHRARATIEIGEAVGWDHAHDVLYAGALDMAVGPRWHSAYEMACQVSWMHLAEDDAKPKSSMEPSPKRMVEARLLANKAPLAPADAERLQRALLDEPEPAYIHEITTLLLAGTDPRQILDAIQVAAARVVLMVGSPANFSMPHHGFEYTNTLKWFYDTFAHPHRLKLLYVAGSFINQAAHWTRNTPGNGEADTRPPASARALSPGALLERLDAAQVALKPDESVAWTRAYLDAGYDRAPLVSTLALCAVKEGNDPHNQEIGLGLVEDWASSTAHDRDTLLLACAHHTAGHQKFGDPLEAYRRFTEALS